MADLNISLFGYPAIELDGAPVAVDERKALALLAYLAVSGTPQSREMLGALLWPEHDQAQSYANLRHALWSLKQAGLAAWLETARETIALRAGFELDVATFQQAIQDRRFDTAAALYGANFLAGFTLRDAPAFDEWQFFQTEQLRQELAATLQQLVAEQRDRGDYEAGIAYARRWLALDGLHEEAHRQLMQLYTLSGQHAAALRQYHECARLLQEEIGSVPEDETTALFEEIKARKLVLPSLSPGHSHRPASHGNLPRQLTSFVGRQQEIAEVTRSLAISTSQLVTLTGSGGCGKTRLALQVGNELRAQYPQGVWFVDLAPLADPALVPQTVASTLGLREEPGRPILATLIDFLRGRKILLILDNCEHVIESSAQLAEAMLHACTELDILATSREALGIAGEVVFRVPSLSTPGPRQSPAIEALLQYESALLFVDRAAAALPGFAVTRDNIAAIAQICQRLDGIPLAIEMAAARVPLLRVEQIAARLDDSFRLLVGGSRTALPRHRTLRATMDWSYSLLSEREQVLLRRLSGFAGGWTLEAAEAVCAGTGQDGIVADAVLDVLAQLSNKSLVIVTRELGEEARYRLLETIRQYAHEKLWEAGEWEKIRARHLDYFLRLAEQAEPELTGRNQGAWLNRLKEEMDNVRAALEWSVERNVEGGLRLSSALWRFCDAHGYVSEVLERLTQLLVKPEALSRTLVRAKALVAGAILTMWQGDFARARSLAEESLATYRECGDKRGEAFSLYGLALVATDMDDFASARSYAGESLALYRSLGDKLGISEALFILGDLKNYPLRRAYLEEVLALCRERGDVFGIVSAVNSLGRAAIHAGDFVAARSWLEESLVLQRTLGIPDLDRTLLGELELHQGDYAQARIYFEESLSVSKATGRTAIALWVFVFLGYVALRQGDEAEARATFVEAQRRFQETGGKIGVVFALEGLASLAVAQSQPERAVRLFAWADAMREAVGDRRPPVEQADVDRDFVVIRSQLDEAAIAAACAEGRAMTMEQAIACALEV
jgi:non-specific serine/threonine protein kinase